MYPDVSQMNLTCSVIFEENTCILTVCMYFDMYPKGVQDTFGIHVRYITRYMYLAHLQKLYISAALFTNWGYCQLLQPP
jgi:hypothetical protein